MFLTIVAFILVLGILVLVHEFGHYITAKISGVKVLEFSIGFPPRIFSFKKNETQYTIGALPLGGYVKMLGEDEQSSDPRSFNRQSIFKRFVIGVAGVLMNVILAWFILTIAFSIGMSPIASRSDEIPGQKIKSQIFIAEIKSGSPAERAGIQIGDKLIGHGDISFDGISDVTTYTGENLGKEVSIKIQRQNDVIEKTVILSEDKSAPMGIGIIDQAVIRVPWYKAPYVAMIESYRVLKYTFSFLGDFAKQLFSTGTISDQVGGPVAIFNLTGVAARAGFVVLLQFIAILSLNLALINIMPLPALDGGRVLFIVLEKIFGKRIVKENVEGIIHTIGFVLLILLVLAVTYKDILRLFS